MSSERKVSYGVDMMLPVFVGFNQEHVMGRARIDVDGNRVTISIESKGRDGLTLAEFLTGGEPVALSFGAIPIQPHIPRQ